MTHLYESLKVIHDQSLLFKTNKQTNKLQKTRQSLTTGVHWLLFCKSYTFESWHTISTLGFLKYEWYLFDREDF
jgi:hypothetical protein